MSHRCDRGRSAWSWYFRYFYHPDRHWSTVRANRTGTNGLSAPIGHAALAGTVVHVSGRIDDAHRRFAALLFERVGGGTREARMHEQGVRHFRRQADVAADGRNGTIDVHWQMPLGEIRMPRQRVLQGADELRVLVIDLELVRDLEQPDR